KVRTKYPAGGLATGQCRREAEGHIMRNCGFSGCMAGMVLPNDSPTCRLTRKDTPKREGRQPRGRSGAAPYYPSVERSRASWLPMFVTTRSNADAGVIWEKYHCSAASQRACQAAKNRGS